MRPRASRARRRCACGTRTFHCYATWTNRQRGDGSRISTDAGRSTMTKGPHATSCAKSVVCLHRPRPNRRAISTVMSTTPGAIRQAWLRPSQRSTADTGMGTTVADTAVVGMVVPRTETRHTSTPTAALPTTRMLVRPRNIRIRARAIGSAPE